MMLSKLDLSRYARQISLSEVGVSGQDKISGARVLVVGAGGLGCPVLQYLAAAGVGTLGIIDDDVVDISNLHRQVLYRDSDIGKSKAEQAAKHLLELNPTIQCKSYPERLMPENIERIISNFDIVVDCSDNARTRYLCDDACRLLSKPLVYGAIHKYEGQVSVFSYPVGASQAFTYRSLFPFTSNGEDMNSCEEHGVLGVLPGLIGTLQAAEVIKIITGIGDVLNGKLLVFNVLNMQSEIMRFQISSSAKNSGPVSIDELRKTDYLFNCNNQENMKEVTVEELHQWLQAGKELRFLDVRQPGEWPEAEGIIDLQIPLPLVEKEFGQIDRNADVIVYCKSGDRSQKAIEILSEKFEFNNLIKLKGGVEEWINFRESLM